MNEKIFYKIFLYLFLVINSNNIDKKDWGEWIR